MSNLVPKSSQFSHARTMHARKGNIDNRFEYNVDFVWIDPENPKAPALFGWDRTGLVSIKARDYGTQEAYQEERPTPAKWVREIFVNAGLQGEFELRLLTQPRILGTLFNPVSFWFAVQGEDAVAFLAEVNNTFSQRHFYLCHHDGFAKIKPEDSFQAQKVFYVSPFQEIDGDYHFQVKIQENKFALRIDFQNGDQGVLATLAGEFRPLTNRSVLNAAFMRPLGGARVFGLIFYQAFKLKSKGVIYRRRPQKPSQEVSS